MSDGLDATFPSFSKGREAGLSVTSVRGSLGVAIRGIKLLLVLLIWTVPATADSVYDVTGALTIVGNNACGGAPCIETLAFSFRVDYQLVGLNAYKEQLVSVPSINSFGPLAPFNTLFASEDFFGFLNSAHDEIDINGPFKDAGLPTAPFPNLIDSELYSCGASVGPFDQTCVTDFASPGNGCCHLNGNGTLQYTATATPEESSLSYVAVGLILLGTLARRCIRT